MRVPSGHQIGDVFSCDASNVNREVVLRDRSVTQMSPPFPSWRWAATCVPSGARSMPR